jgi:hypothetical protein
VVSLSRQVNSASGPCQLEGFITRLEWGASHWGWLADLMKGMVGTGDIRQGKKGKKILNVLLTCVIIVLMISIDVVDPLLQL